MPICFPAFAPAHGALTPACGSGEIVLREVADFPPAAPARAARPRDEEKEEGTPRPAAGSGLDQFRNAPLGDVGHLLIHVSKVA